MSCDDYNMNPSRRRWLAGAAAAAASGLAGLGGALLLPDEGFLNPCLAPDPDHWHAHPVVRDALAGLDLASLWDTHAHLFPAGTIGHVHGLWGAFEHWGDDGPWPAPAMQLQRQLLANAACVQDNAADPVQAYLAPLLERLRGMPEGCKMVLLAMDAFHDNNGKARAEKTHFSVPNDLCARAVRTWPERLEWAASVHPYRADAAEELARAKRLGARAVKWIPAAQGIDPASPRCDAMYRALAEHRLPLITHGGDERATAGDDALGNPLRLRRALDAGVRVIVAHCATMGDGVDLDIGQNGPAMSNFALFERLMNEARYESLLFGDLAAIGQRARTGPALAALLRQAAPGAPWSRRLLFGSDYPLAGLMPLYSVQGLHEQGFLDAQSVAPLRELRRHNAWLFDLVLKRRLRWQGHAFATEVFDTRRAWFDS